MNKEKVLLIIDNKIQELKERKDNSLSYSTKSRINFCITQIKELFFDIEKA